MHFGHFIVAYYLVTAGLAEATGNRAALEVGNSVGIYLELLLSMRIGGFPAEPDAPSYNTIAPELFI